MTIERLRLLRRVATALLVLAMCGYATLLFALDRVMHQSPEQFGRFMSKMPIAVFLVALFETMWTRARAGHLNVGDRAPDFSLSTLDTTAHLDLASLRQDQPVVPAFGSYAC